MGQEIKVHRRNATKVTTPNKMHLFAIFTQTQLGKEHGFSKNTDENGGVLSHHTSLPSTMIN